MNRHGMKRVVETRRYEELRRGAFMVLAAVCLVTAMGFVSLCVDVGYLSLAKQRMQNGVDAAALAGAMEITHAIQTAGPDVANVAAYAEAQARLKARDVAALNGIYVDPDRDVSFGHRKALDNNGNWTITWNQSPCNVVRVHARRDNPNAAAPDSKLKLFFAGVLGDKTASLVTSAAAYVESRDIVCVLDFSGSMNDDSSFYDLSTRNQAAIESNMVDIFNTLNSLRNLGNMPFEPQWLTQNASAGGATGTTVFRNTAVDVTTSKPMTSMKLTFSDGTTQITSASGTSGTFERNHTKKLPIDKVEATVQWENWGSTMTGTASTSGRTANVTFNGNSNISVTTSHNMSQVTFVYHPSGTSSVSKSGTSTTATGNGSYIKSVQVKVGSYTITVNNPNGSSPQVINQTLTFNHNVTNILNQLGMPSAYPWAQGSWSDYVNHCRTSAQIASANYPGKYGGKTLVNYLLEVRPGFHQTEDLWQTPCYPFHSMKQGALLFANFVENLGFDDEIGFVSYDSDARTEHTLNYDGYNFNMSSNPINKQFSNFRELVRHKQAGHYDIYTNIGGGLLEAKTLLDASARPGSRPTILLMTDGIPNRPLASYSLPSGWNWNTLFDYDGNGVADYTTNNTYARYALGMAKQAVDAGYTIHTLSVGADADAELMKAIAWMGHGVSITVPGNSSVAAMEAEILEAFNRIAAFVPPAKLVSTD